MKRAVFLLLVACDAAIDGTYSADPMAESFSPQSGRSTGGDPITILGRGFEDVERVTIGGTEAELVERSDRSLRAVSPAHAVGAVEVVLEANGRSLLAGTFRYLPSRIQFGAEDLFPVPGLVAAAGQLDRDPAADLAVLEQRTVDTWGEATLLIGAPGEPLVAAFEIPSFTPSAQDTELQPVDLDADGLDDLILYTWSWYDSVHDINVMMNRGDSTFEGRQIADDLDLYEAEFFATDLDRDGHVDFGWMGATLMVFWGHGDGTFDEPETFPMWNRKGERKKTLAISVVEEGLFGVNLEAKESARVRFLDHVPAIERAPFVASSTIAALIGTEVVLVSDLLSRCGFREGDFGGSAVGDIDGDGTPDLVGWSLNVDGCLLYGGEGGFSDETRAVPHDRNVVEGALVADFDGDGYRDILRIERSYSDDSLRYHRMFYGPGLVRVPSLAQGTMPLVAGGVITVVDDRKVIALRADGTEVLFELEQPFNGPTRVAAHHDFTGDGTSDLLLLTERSYLEHPVLVTEAGLRTVDGVYLGHTGDAVAVLQGDRGELQIGERRLWFEVAPNERDRPEHCLFVADFDGDGIADVAQTCLDDHIELRLGAIDGDRLILAEPATWTIDYWFWDRPHFTDVDDDGDIDLIGTGENGRVELRLNEAGDFHTLVMLDLGAELEIQGTADLDGDGVRELLFYRGGLDLQFVRWRGEQLEGPYSIQDLAHHDPPWREPPVYAVDYPDGPGIRRHEDLDGDGLADLVMTTRSGFWPYSADNILVLRNVSW